MRLKQFVRAIGADAAKQGCWVAGAHIAFPGIGNIRAAGKGCDWVPANYSVVR